MKLRMSVAVAAAIFPLLSAMSAAAQVPAGGTRTANPTAIVGTVSDSASRPLAGAAVTIKQGESSAIVTGALTDSKGKFRIEGLSTGKYRVHIGYIGFKANVQDIELSSSTLTANLGAVKLATDAIAVEGVTATALRSSMTVGVDRNIYSTKNMPAASGGNTTDLLRNVPELDVDVDGNVKLQGSQSIALHINGRPAPMRGEALKNFLAMLPANRVDRVEIVPNPSAKYDPEGIAGIVNIVLKGDMDLGFSGSVGVNLDSRGRHGSNVSLNYQKGRLTLFGNTAFNLNATTMHLLDLRKNLLVNPTTYFSNEVSNDMSGHFMFFDGSAEYKLSKLNTAFASARLMSANNNMQGLQVNQIQDANRAPILWFDWNNDNSFSFGNDDASAGIRRVVKPQQNEATLELRYTGNAQNQNQNYIKEFLTTTGQQTSSPDEIGLTRANTDVGEFSAKIDVTRPLSSNYKVDVGVKGALRGTDYNNRLTRTLESAASPFSSANSVYSYDENYQQAYLLANRQFGRLGVQLGARGEIAHTNFQLPNGQTYDNDYNNIFPSVNLSYTKNQQWSARFAYSKRLDRPQPNMLNPGQPSADSLNIFVGNPTLKPKYTHSFTTDLTHQTAWGMIKLSPYYRKTTNNWDFFKTVDDRGVSTLSWQNTRSIQQYGSNITVSARAGTRANGFLSLNAYEFKRDATGFASLSDPTTGGFRWDINANAMGTVRKDLMVQAFVRYQAPQDMPQGKISSSVFSNLGLRQNILKGKGSLSLAIVDPFDKFKFKFETNDKTHQQLSENNIKIRSVRLAFNYNFGKPPSPTVRRTDDQTVDPNAAQPQIR